MKHFFEHVLISTDGLSFYSSMMVAPWVKVRACVTASNGVFKVRILHCCVCAAACLGYSTIGMTFVQTSSYHEIESCVVLLNTDNTLTRCTQQHLRIRRSRNDSEIPQSLSTIQ